MEHFHGIYSVYLVKVPYEIPGNVPKQCLGILNTGIPVTCIFYVDHENAIAVFSSGYNALPDNR